MRKITYAWVFMALCGCVMGDAGTRVAGLIVDENGTIYEHCKIELFSVGSDDPFNYRQIRGDFRESFVIYADQTNYKVSLSCSGAENQYVAEQLRLGPLSSPNDVVNFGTITLKRADLSP